MILLNLSFTPVIKSSPSQNISNCSLENNTSSTFVEITMTYLQYPQTKLIIQDMG